MPDAEKILAIIIREVLPAGIAFMNNNKRIEIEEKVDLKTLEHYDKLKAFNISRPVKPATVTVEETPHVDSPGCKTCGSKFDFRRTHQKQVVPLGVAGGKDPHLSYTVNQLSKHLALLQDHYSDYRCENCISKHLMIIEGLAEEGMPMVQDPLEKQRFVEVQSWVKQARGRSDWQTLIDESRQARLLLTGMEHESHASHDDEEEA